LTISTVRRWFTPQRLLDSAVALGLVAAAVTVVAAAVLSRVYRPSSPGFDPVLHPGHPAGATEGWLAAHASASAILGMAAFLSLLLLVWPMGRPAPWRQPAPIGAAAVATLAAAAAIVTRDMLTFDQIALASVRVGTGISGYWFAAFDDDVVFLLIDGAEVGQSTYARTLVVHLVAPVVCALALGLMVRSSRRAVTEDRSPPSVFEPGGPAGS
jgi:hypothetical protein